MGENLGRLRLGETVVHRLIEMEGHLCDLARGDERTDGHEASIPRRKVGRLLSTSCQQSSCESR